MSIQSEITRITNKRNDSFTEVTNKGVTVPSGSTIDDLPGLIRLIPTGSSGSGGPVYQDEDGYVHLSDTGGAAIGYIDSLDANGGTIRNIYGIDLSNDTVTAATLGSGATAHNAQGQAITGTAKIGGWTADEIVSGQISGDLVLTTNPLYANNKYRTNIFSNCSGITSVTSLEGASYISGNEFEYCASLKTVSFQDPSKSNWIGQEGLRDCKNLECVVFVNGHDIYQMALGYCNKLSIFDTARCNMKAANAFIQCSSLKTIILRSPDTLGALYNVNCFNLTPYASNGSGGTIYLSKEMYAHLGDGSALDYKAATNWSTLDGYGKITWKSLEGSPYEFVYADGRAVWQLGIKSFTNCSLSITSEDTRQNSTQTAFWVRYNNPFTATVSANSGYTLSSVTVEMNGVDVTSTVYNSSTNVIDIASVTGPITVTATAS